MKKIFTLAALLLSLACFSQQAIFLKVGNIEGDSKDKAHNNWIDAFAFTGGVSNSGTASTGGGAGAGKANVQDYILTICLDRAVNQLRSAVQKGTRFDKVEIEIARNINGTEKVYMKVLMEDVLITSLSEGGSAGEDKFTLNVSFNFARYKNTYIPVNPNGTTGTPLVSGWSIENNAPYN